MRIRLVGPPDECATVAALREHFDVLDVREYPATREPGSVRVYLEAAPRETGPAWP